jgi:hypothetical protein
MKEPSEEKEVGLKIRKKRRMSLIETYWSLSHSNFTLKTIVEWNI